MGFFSKSKEGKNHGKSKKKSGKSSKNTKKGGKSKKSKKGGKSHSKSHGEHQEKSSNCGWHDQRKAGCCSNSQISLDSDHLMQRHTPVIRLHEDKCNKTHHPPCEEEDTEDEYEEQEKRRCKKKRVKISEDKSCAFDDDKLDSCEECQECCHADISEEDHLCGECPHSNEKLLYPSLQELDINSDDPCQEDSNLYETFNESRMITRLGYKHYKETVRNEKRAKRKGPIRKLEEAMCRCEEDDCDVCNPRNRRKGSDSYGGCDPCKPKKRKKKKKCRDSYSFYSRKSDFSRKSSCKPARSSCYSQYEDDCRSKPNKYRTTFEDCSSFRSIQTANYQPCRNTVSCECGCGGGGSTRYSSRRGGRPSRGQRRKSSSGIIDGLIEIPCILIDAVTSFVMN